jgi:uncharacterized protein (TIGR03435 family)
MRSCAILASVCVLVALVANGEAEAHNAVSDSVADCAADPQLPAFEVAAITPLAPKARGLTNIGQYGLPRFDMKGVTLSLLLSFSFDVQPANFIGAPARLEDAVFDVQVESAGGTPLTYEALKPRMQQMLERRFCLKAHTGTKEASGYDLVVAKGGATLTRSNALGERGTAYIASDELAVTNSELPVLAGLLSSAAGRPVKDQTGLQGKYTVKLQFATSDDPSPTLPSIFTAVKEQLGLELKPAKVPVPTLTIEHINLSPTDN